MNANDVAVSVTCLVELPCRVICSVICVTWLDLEHQLPIIYIDPRASLQVIDM